MHQHLNQWLSNKIVTEWASGCHRPTHKMYSINMTWDIMYGLHNTINTLTLPYFNSQHPALYVSWNVNVVFHHLFSTHTSRGSLSGSWGFPAHMVAYQMSNSMLWNYDRHLCLFLILFLLRVASRWSLFCLPFILPALQVDHWVDWPSSPPPENHVTNHMRSPELAVATTSPHWKSCEVWDLTVLFIIK